MRVIAVVLLCGLVCLAAGQGRRGGGGGGRGGGRGRGRGPRIECADGNRADCERGNTVCPGSSDPFYIVTNYIKWVTTSWTYCTIMIKCRSLIINS